MLSTVFEMTISELCPTSAPFFGLYYLRQYEIERVLVIL